MNVERMLKNAIKVAAVLLTSPATLAVAGRLYTDVPVYRVIVQVAALILVEGALILGWWELDNDRKAETGQRMLYAGLSSTAYVALWVIAVSHGEGIAGIMFRATLGVLLFYSVAESGILANLRQQNRVQRDVTRHRAVRRYRTRAEIAIAKLQVDYWKSTATDSLQKQHTVDSRELSLQHKAVLAELSETGTVQRGSYPYPVDSINSAKATRKTSRVQSLAAYVDRNPDKRATDYVQWAQDSLGVSDSTAWKYLREIRQDGQHATDSS